MKTFTARVAIYCDVDIETEDSFDAENYDSDELDALFAKAFENAPELCDKNSKKPVEDCGYEVLSIWDDEKHRCIFEN